MSGSWFHESRSAVRVEFKGALFMLLLAPTLCGAGSTLGAQSASASLALRVIVPPVFRVLDVTARPDGGFGYRVWTNMPVAHVNGHEFRFTKVGEATISLPASTPGLLMVHGL
jgi:hypothetical protein